MKKAFKYLFDYALVLAIGFGLGMYFGERTQDWSIAKLNNAGINWFGPDRWEKPQGQKVFQTKAKTPGSSKHNRVVEGWIDDKEKVMTIRVSKLDMLPKAGTPNKEKPHSSEEYKVGRALEQSTFDIEELMKVFMLGALAQGVGEGNIKIDLDGAEAIEEFAEKALPKLAEGIFGAVAKGIGEAVLDEAVVTEGVKSMKKLGIDEEKIKKAIEAGQAANK